MNLVRRVQSLEERALARAASCSPAPLDSPANVLAVLAEQMNEVRADLGADPVERARVLVGLAAVALRGMEARDLDARLEAVERVLKLRRDEEQKNKR